MLSALAAALALPAPAQAHGPIDPAASSYEAHVTVVPAGTEAQVVDGDLRLWMRESPRLDAVVLDYQGAPYLRFTAAGVFANHRSAMWYLNQVPPEIPPIDLGPDTPPQWHQVSTGHTYQWHDGRLHALATEARAPGATFIGRWSIHLRVDGVPTAIGGTMTYAPDPSPVWFWPILVALACVLAVLRLDRPDLDQRLARILGAITIAAFVIAALARQLHGRPGIDVGPLIELAVELAFAGWAVLRLARRPQGWFAYFAIAAAAIWQGATLVGTLVYGYVLLALPAFPSRVAVVACLAAGVGLLPVVFALAERPARRRSARRKAPTQTTWEPTG